MDWYACELYTLHTVYIAKSKILTVMNINQTKLNKVPVTARWHISFDNQPGMK